MPFTRPSAAVHGREEIALIVMARSSGRELRCRCRSGTARPPTRSCCFSWAKFSITPLWTTAMRVVGVEMRVGVAVGGAAVRRPARVADAVAARCRVRRDQLVQFRQPPGLLPQGAVRCPCRSPCRHCRSPRYSSRRRPSRRTGEASRRPVNPTIPHIFDSPGRRAGMF